MPSADATREPETMTADERRDEVASILARGVIRAVRTARLRSTQDIEPPAESPSALPTRPPDTWAG